MLIVLDIGELQLGDQTKLIENYIKQGEEYKSNERHHPQLWIKDFELEVITEKESNYERRCNNSCI